MLNRRDVLVGLGGSLAAAHLAGCGAQGADESALPMLPADRRWLAKLGEGLHEEHDYEAEVEGGLPDGLCGTLYRNGPGLFERGGFKKSTLLDGDGMIRATTFADGKVRFRNRFVRTKKYAAEEQAGRFLYPTWTTPAPGLFDNIPSIPALSQAGITPVLKDGTLYAFDEVGAPYGIDPQTLETTGMLAPYLGENGPTSYKAHTKTDGASGHWVLVGSSGRARPVLHVLVKDERGGDVAHIAMPSPRQSYYHDFFWTGRHVVIHLQPAILSPLPMLLGASTFADSLEWRPEEGSQLLVIDPAGGAPIRLDVPACWVWHNLNAFTSGNTIVADCVGYDAPDHFLGRDAALRAIMQGREGVAKAPGTLRRFTIDLDAKRARVDTLVDGHFEFPIVHPARTGQRHRYGYVASGNIAESWFHDGIARIDTETSASRAFHFGPGYYVGEPIFAPDPTRTAAPMAAEEPGWLLCEVLEGSSGKSFLAIFDADALTDGPVAKVRLRHHLPLSFHGWWLAA
jgi:all-trans-8'-apo-beta-carotenal 15,15'-oxygenase